jgi:hypothetical protein
MTKAKRLKMVSMTPEQVLELQRTYEATHVKMNTPALEVLNELFHRIPFGAKFTLANGRTATIEPFFEPREVEGRLTAGIDVTYEDGSGHYEFTLEQTGWGGVP